MARYNITRTGAVARRNGTNEVLENNRYEEETRRILEKLGRIAHAVAEKLGWDEGLVMRDMVKDLALINDPSLIAQLDPNNPVDQMTDQIMRMYLDDGEAFNEMRNTAVTRIMNMREEDAANLLYQMFNQGQLSGSQYQRLENRNRRLIGDKLIEPTEQCLDFVENILQENGWLIERKGKTLFGAIHYQVRSDKNDFTKENWMEFVKTNLDEKLEKAEDEFNCPITLSANLMEDGTITAGVDIREMSVMDSKKGPSKFKDSANEEAFTAKFGAKNLQRFNRIKQKLEGNMRDITWITAHIETPEELNEAFNNVEFGTYEPIAENEDYIVFDIDSLQMCQDLARGTNWCIAVPSAYNVYANYGAKYNFYINKINGDKYCVAMVGDGKEIVDKNDRELASLPEGVPGEAVKSSVVEEDMSTEDALLQTTLANIQILPVDTLRIAYDDMFGEELDMLEDEDVKAWLSEQIPNIDTNELKTYIEEHLEDFAVVPTREETDMDEIEYDEDYERAWGPEEDEEDEDDEDEEN